jgi:cell division protein FtsL
MSEKPPNYSDPEDKVDYQVIKSSYGRANKTSARNNLYFLVALTIIVLLCAMVFFQSLKIGDLKERVTNLETKVTNLESQVTNLESQVTNLESQVTIAFSTTLSLANLLGYQGLKRQENWENHLAQPFL